MDAALHDSARTCGVFVTFHAAFPGVGDGISRPRKAWGYLFETARKIGTSYSFLKKPSHAALYRLLSGGIHSGFRSVVSL